MLSLSKHEPPQLSDFFTNSSGRKTTKPFVAHNLTRLVLMLLRRRLR